MKDYIAPLCIGGGVALLLIAFLPENRGSTIGFLVSFLG